MSSQVIHPYLRNGASSTNADDSAVTKTGFDYVALFNKCFAWPSSLTKEANGNWMSGGLERGGGAVEGPTLSASAERSGGRRRIKESRGEG